MIRSAWAAPATKMRRILITGGSGQLGTELQNLDWPEDVCVSAPSRTELSLTSPSAVDKAFAETQYALVINAAAYTAVDKAEDETAEAFAANALAPAVLADVTRKAGIPMIQVSTDYVFDGLAADWYSEDSSTTPQGVYGASKLAGEYAALTGNPRTIVLRTAWVFSPHGSNFVKTMLRVGAQSGKVRVVADQSGCPSSAADIADAIRHIALRLMDDEANGPSGVYHFVNAGEATWHEFAQEIFSQSLALGGREVEATAIMTSEYPTRARRPKNSRLSTRRLTADFGITPRPWREALADTMTELSERNAL
jgi:dTDP-4-dehydrorhamnose reductase